MIRSVLPVYKYVLISPNHRTYQTIDYCKRYNFLRTSRILTLQLLKVKPIEIPILFFCQKWRVDDLEVMSLCIYYSIKRKLENLSFFKNCF